MIPIDEHSAGVIPFRRNVGRSPVYLVIHSATVRNPRSRWEFPKGGIEPGESPREAATREFGEETGIISWAFREGFERSLSYTYLRHGRKRFKTVVYFVAEVFDTSTMVRSHEHMEDPFGRWYHWGSFEQIARLLCHAKIRHLFSETDAWINEGLAKCQGVQDRYRREAATPRVAADRCSRRERAMMWGGPNTIPVMGPIQELSDFPAPRLREPRGRTSPAAPR